MAWVEAAGVFYLRRLVDRIEPYQPNPLPVAGDIGGAELVREAATLVMLFTVGWLAGRTGRSRFGYFVAAFGVWDIFYYVFLIPMTGWPRSVLDWDILFLIPLPWWGPVLAPVMIAVLMIVGGVVLAFNDERDAPPLWPAKWSLWLSGLGVVLALYVFMADAISAVRRGASIQTMLPVTFNWPLFLVAWVLMALPAVELLRQCLAQRQAIRNPQDGRRRSTDMHHAKNPATARGRMVSMVYMAMGALTGKHGTTAAKARSVQRDNLDCAPQKRRD